MDTGTLKAGDRVARKDSDEHGTVTEADGVIKVKWDGGATSHFKRGEIANVRPAKEQHQPAW